MVRLPNQTPVNQMAKSLPWSIHENKALLRAYGLLVDAEAEGRYLNKRQLVRTLQAGILSNRSKGSIEAKFMNISAACEKYGFGYVTGYRPAANMQRSLLPMVRQWLTIRENAGLPMPGDRE